MTTERGREGGGEEGMITNLLEISMKHTVAQM